MVEIPGSKRFPAAPDAFVPQQFLAPVMMTSFIRSKRLGK
jgi:hypothetical protein